MAFNKTFAGWTFLLILSAAVLLSRLPFNPPGFMADESIYGSEAHSLLYTGKSLSGELFPRFLLNPETSERNHTSYVYFIVPLIALLGTTETAVRLTSVLISLLTLSLLFVLLKKTTGLFTSLLILSLWPFSGWVFLISRLGVELILSAFFVTLVILLFQKATAPPKPPFPLVMALGFSLLALHYSYSAGKLIAVVLFVYSLLLGLIRRWGLGKLGILMASFLLTIYLSVSYIRDGSYFFRADELFTCPPSVVRCYIDNLISHLKPESYFGNSYTPRDYPVPRHSITNTSLIPRILAPFLYLGLLVILYRTYRGNSFSYTLVFAAVTIVLPASLTLRGFDSYRSHGLLPIVFMISGVGFHLLFRLARNFYLKLGLILIFSFSAYLQLLPLLNYEYNTAAASYSGFQYGYRQILTYISLRNPSPNQVWVTPFIADVPQLYTRFFDPDRRYPHIRIADFPADLASITPRDLIVVPPQDTPPGFVLEKIIYYPNGQDEAFYIGKLP